MNLLTLKRIVPPEHAKDVARLKRILNKAGYDAAEVDLEAAYAGWSGSLPNKPAWHPLSYLTDDKKVLEILLKQLGPDTKEIEL
jgi:hypothetical protein